jgi:hypothetical protein
VRLQVQTHTHVLQVTGVLVKVYQYRHVVVRVHQIIIVQVARPHQLKIYVQLVLIHRQDHHHQLNVVVQLVILVWTPHVRHVDIPHIKPLQVLVVVPLVHLEVTQHQSRQLLDHYVNVRVVMDIHRALANYVRLVYTSLWL